MSPVGGQVAARNPVHRIAHASSCAGRILTEHQGMAPLAPLHSSPACAARDVLPPRDPSSVGFVPLLASAEPFETE